VSSAALVSVFTAVLAVVSALTAGFASVVTLDYETAGVFDTAAKVCALTVKPASMNVNRKIALKNFVNIFFISIRIKIIPHQRCGAIVILMLRNDYALMILFKCKLNVTMPRLR